MLTKKSQKEITKNYVENFQKSKLVIKAKFFFDKYNAPFFIFIISRLVILLTLWLMSAHSFDAATLNRWDATNYTSIAENGYQFNGEYKEEGAWIAFFPFYSFLINLVHQISNFSFLNSAYIVSFFAGLGSALLLFKIVLNWKDRQSAIAAVSLFSFYPYSFFLSAPYTESTFMFLILLTFYLFKKSSTVLYSAIFVSMACITKLNAGIIGLILVWEVWKKTKSFIKTFFISLATGIPFFSFLYFQNIKYGTPFAFLVAQKENWGHTFVFPWIGFVNFAKGTIYDTNLMGMRIPEFFILLLMIITLGISFKKIPLNIWIFGTGILVLTLCSNFILGMGRYLVPVIPFYFYWGWFLSKKPLIRQLFLIVSACWMVFNTVLFSLSKNIF